MFYGRDWEISEFERLYRAGTFQMVIVYGRRRVGKSALISRFVQGTGEAEEKRAVFFTAIESDSRRNLEVFSRALMKLRGIRGEISFSRWEEAFDEAAALAAGEPLVLVIDEYPYLAQAERSISSLLQHYCDTVFRGLPLMIILCGSSMSFMENQVLGYQSPLYGRRTAQMKIEAFDYRDSAAFVPAYSLEEKALVYGLTGGIPKYLELFDDSLSLKENVIKNFFSPTGYLYEEPSNLLKQELREPVKYNLIIEAVAKGATRLNLIATKTGLETSAVANYIASLMSLGIMRKESAVTEEKNKRKTLYRLADTMFVFWYRYVLGNEFSIQTGEAPSLYDAEVAPDLSRFMGAIFETMCRQYLAALNGEEGRLPFKIRQMGRWWGSSPAARTEEEIDIVGVNEKSSAALFCECKFRNEAADASVLKALMEKASRWSGYPRKYYMLFSKSGFTPALREAQKQDEALRLVDLGAMY
jgi:AAA+ ATPase superfamily predicted ATPase